MATRFKHRKGAEAMDAEGNMTLGGHLKELRNRVMICAVIYFVAAVGFLAIAADLINFLTAIADGVYNFISIDPQEKLIQYFRVALIAALIVDIPFIAYHIYAFAKPGLKKSESFFFGLVLVLGLEKAQEVLDRAPDVQAYLIYADENGKDQVFATPGMKKLITTP